jgi:hypothetical protein
MEQDERARLRHVGDGRDGQPSKSVEWCRDKGIEVKVHSEGTNTAGGYTVPECCPATSST